MAPPLRVVCFDYGGVLGSEVDDWGGKLLPVTDAAGLSVGEMEGLWALHWPALRIGAHDLPVFWHAITLAAADRVSEETLARTYTESITADPHMLHIARALQARGFRLIVAANESQSGMNAKSRKFNLAEMFEKVYCSAFMGIMKPDPALFAYLAHDMGVEPSTVLCIEHRDDYIRSAEETGMRTIRFENPAQLRSRLERLLGISLYS